MLGSGVKSDLTAQDYTWCPSIVHIKYDGDGRIGVRWWSEE